MTTEGRVLSLTTPERGLCLPSLIRLLRFKFGLRRVCDRDGPRRGICLPLFMRAKIVQDKFHTRNGLCDVFRKSFVGSIENLAHLRDFAVLYAHLDVTVIEIRVLS